MNNKPHQSSKGEQHGHSGTTPGKRGSARGAQRSPSDVQMILQFGEDFNFDQMPLSARSDRPIPAARQQTTNVFERLSSPKNIEKYLIFSLLAFIDISLQYLTEQKHAPKK